MRIGSTPGRDERSQHDEIEAALHGEERGPNADAWRELRADVRLLAPAMHADFERLMSTRIEEWTAAAHRAEDSATRRRVARRRPRHIAELLKRGHVAGLAAAVCTLLIATVVVLSLRGGGHGGGGAPPRIASQPAKAATSPSTGGGSNAQGRLDELGPSASGESNAPEHGPVANAAGAEGGVSTPTAPGHVQRLAASVTLSSIPGEVQALADRVARLAVGDGGYVQSSQVVQQTQGASEATLDLNVPSAKLAGVLASLERLAPIRAENQSSQDITSEYDSAKRNLADAEAERRALLRALSRAETQTQVESLRQQLSLTGETIAKDQAAVRAVSQQASSSTLEVAIAGDAHAEGLTLRHGVHDAGRVLTVALVILIVGVAVLVPLAIACALLLAGAGAWRRHARERALA
jgi:hypothetical protein